MKIPKDMDFSDPQWAEKEVERVRAKRAKGIYYPLDSDDEDNDIDEYYCVLIDPNGNELCYLGEPEDRNFYRDGKPLVEELNRLHKELERYKEKEHNDRPWGPEDLKPC